MTAEFAQGREVIPDSVTISPTGEHIAYLGHTSDFDGKVGFIKNISTGKILEVRNLRRRCSLLLQLAETSRQIQMHLHLNLLCSLYMDPYTFFFFFVFITVCACLYTANSLYISIICDCGKFSQNYY